MKTRYEVWDRRRRSRVEMPIWNAERLHFYYATRPGRLLTRALMSLPFVSALAMRSRYRPSSKAEIPAFIDRYKIPIDEIERPLDSFETFNDFFIRTLKRGARPVDPDPDSVVTPSDGQIQVFPSTTPDTVFTIKGTRFTLGTILGDRALASRLEGAAVCSIYLAAYDYHRFHYPLTGQLVSRTRIGNRLFVVNPEISAANGFKPFDHNLRDVNVLECDRVGTVAQVEIGAYLVGRVVQVDEALGPKTKGAEKGYFAFGGSSLLLAFPNGSIEFDEDLVEQSGRGIATLVKMGERIARIIPRAR